MAVQKSKGKLGFPGLEICWKLCLGVFKDPIYALTEVFLFKFFLFWLRNRAYGSGPCVPAMGSIPIMNDMDDNFRARGQHHKNDA